MIVLITLVTSWKMLEESSMRNAGRTRDDDDLDSGRREKWIDSRNN